jgi:capsular polysaccharide transport system permease protein
MANLVHSLTVQARVVYAVMSRELRVRHISSPVGVFSALVEPLGTLLVFATIMTYIRFRHPSIGESLILFLMTGIFTLSCFRGGLSGAERVFERMKRSLAIPEISPLDLMLAGALVNFLTIAVLFHGITAFYILVYDADVPKSVLLPMVPMAGVMLMGIGFAGINMTIKIWFPFWGKIFSTLIAPINILSGMFYTADTVPPMMLKYVSWNPLFHATEACRQWYFPSYDSPMFDPWYFFSWVFGLLFVGVLCERFFRYRLLALKT